jgi:hypothetical protein
MGIVGEVINNSRACTRAAAAVRARLLRFAANVTPFLDSVRIRDPGASTARLSSTGWKTADRLSAPRPTERAEVGTERGGKEESREADKVNAD